MEPGTRVSASVISVSSRSESVRSCTAMSAAGAIGPGRRACQPTCALEVARSTRKYPQEARTATGRSRRFSLTGGNGSSRVTASATTVPLSRFAHDQVLHSRIQTSTSVASAGNWRPVRTSRLAAAHGTPSAEEAGPVAVDRLPVGRRVEQVGAGAVR